jgi:hypothetical protein
LKNNLQRFCEEKDRDLTWLAQAIGIPYGTLYGYASGDRKIPEETLRKAAKLLQKTVEEVLDVRENVLQESGMAYRGELPVDALRDDDLMRLYRTMFEESMNSNGEEKRKRLRWVQSIAAELERREK